MVSEAVRSTALIHNSSPCYILLETHRVEFVGSPSSTQQWKQSQARVGIAIGTMLTTLTPIVP
ncbi:MAG: hypothetical protein ACXVZX_01405 [Terriglobales bacterium]